MANYKAELVGVFGHPIAENPTVETVEPGSPAEKAGAKAGDVIVAVSGQNVAASKDVVESPIGFSR